MNAKLIFATLAAVCAVSLAMEKMPTIDKKFMDEEVCGDKGAKTLAHMEGICKEEMAGLTGKREEVCKAYNNGEGDGLEKAQEEIGKIVKAMSDQEKKDIGKCLCESYEKAHGVKFEHCVKKE